MDQNPANLSVSPSTGSPGFTDSRFTTYLNAMENGIAVYSSHDGERFILEEINAVGAAMAGTIPAAVKGREVREVFPGIVKMGLFDVFRRVWIHGAAESFPSSLYQDSRIVRWYENRVYRISESEIVAVFEDITGSMQEDLKNREREDNLRLILETSQAGIIMGDITGTITYANPRFAGLLGYRPEEIVGMHYREFVHPDDRDASLGSLRDLIDGSRETVDSERRYRRKDGTLFWGHLTAGRVVDNDGVFRGLVGHVTDINVRKESEAALIASEQRFQAIFNSVSDAIFIHDIETGALVDINQSACDLYGIDRNRLGRLKVADISANVPPYTQEQALDNMQRAAAGAPMVFEWWARHSDGRLFWVEVSMRRAEVGSTERIIVSVRDISGRKQAEMTLRESEERFKALSEAAFGGIIIHDKGVILECNQGLSDITGFSYEEHIGMDGLRLIAPESLEIVTANIAKGYDRSYEVTGLRKDGSRYPLAIKGKNVFYKGRQARVIEFRDISESKYLENALRESEERLANVIRNAPVILFVLDMEGRFTFSDGKGLHLLGLHPGDVVGLSAYELYREWPTATVGVERALKGETFSTETTVGDKTFEIWYNPMLDSSGRQYGSIGVATDITDRKRLEAEHRQLEQQLLHTQKLESLGVLAGGIAHDFNNILMSIIGNAELALRRINRESPASDNLIKIEQAATRAADLARQMLAYSGKGRFVIECIDLNLLLEEMLHMLEVSISKNVVLRFSLHSRLPAVEADATQMRQILMNLVINASEAIGDKSGVIAITTGCMDCSERYLKDIWLHDNISEGLYVYLEVADTGSGMTREVMAKLFDPFFTTKFTGRGLGMSAVLGIVRGHKGAIKVYSEPGKGSTFKILLPASGRPAELFNDTAHGDTWLGQGRVLLVDDEETIRGIGSEMLKELGFTPLTAEDGRQAMSIFMQNSDIDFVILDLTMPHMDGEQCFRELRMINPNVRVIMSSGYNEQEVTQKFVGKGLAGFIQKPYNMATLREALKKAALANEP